MKPAEAEEDEDQLTARRESQNVEQTSGNAEGERDQSRSLNVLIYPLFKVFKGLTCFSRSRNTFSASAEQETMKTCFWLGATRRTIHQISAL